MALLPTPLSPKRLLKLPKSHKNSHAALSLFDAATSTPAYAPHPRRLPPYPPPPLGAPARPPLIRAQKCDCYEEVSLTTIKAYSRNSMVDQTLDVFKQMAEVFGCEPGVRSHNSMLNCFVESRQWEKAESFLLYFEGLDLKLDLDTYNILLKLSCKRGQFDREKRLLDWMWIQGMSPNYTSFFFLSF